MTTAIQTQAQALNAYIAAASSSKLLDLQPQDLNTVLVASLSKLGLAHGVPIEKEDLVFLATELRLALADEFPAIRSGQLEHALQLASRGVYGTAYAKITLARTLEWLRQYFDDPRRMQAIQTAPRVLELPPAALTSEQKFNLLVDSIAVDYQLYISGRRPNNPGGTTYDALFKAEVIRATKAQRTALVEACKAELLQKLENERKTTPRADVHLVNREINELLETDQPAIRWAKIKLINQAFAELQKIHADDIESLKLDLRDLLKTLAHR